MKVVPIEIDDSRIIVPADRLVSIEICEGGPDGERKRGWRYVDVEVDGGDGFAGWARVAQADGLFFSLTTRNNE